MFLRLSRACLGKFVFFREEPERKKTKTEAVSHLKMIISKPTYLETPLFLSTLLMCVQSLSWQIVVFHKS